MAAPVQKGNEILIPLFDGAALGQPITVKWQQDFSQRQEGYYQLIADNLATGMSWSGLEQLYLSVGVISWMY